MLSASGGIFISSFPNYMPFFSFFLSFHLGKNFQFSILGKAAFAINCAVTRGLCMCSLWVKETPLYFRVHWAFSSWMAWLLNLVKCFSCINPDNHTIFLLHFQMLNQPEYIPGIWTNWIYVPEINPTLLWLLFFLYILGFVLLTLSQGLLHPSSQEILVCSFSGVVSLTGLGIRVTLAYKMSWECPSFPVFWNGLCEIGINSLNVCTILQWNYMT